MPRLALALALLSLALASPAAGRQNGSQPVPPGHWSYELLEILDAAGAAAAWMARIQAVPASTVRQELDRARRHGFVSEALLSHWLARFDREFPGADPSRASPSPAASVEAGVRSGSAFLDPGAGEYLHLTGAVGVHPALAVWGSYDAGGRRHLAGLRSLGLGTAFGPFSLQLGRQRLRAAGPGLVSVQLNGDHALDALHLTSRRAILPPVLDWLTGPTYWQFGFAPWDDVADLRAGWVAIASGIIQPHPALELGFSRVVRFAGDGVPGISPERLARMLIMVQNRPMNWDDQKLELTLRARWRILGRPMAGYAVIAQEDAPIWKDAGVILGLHLPFVWSGGLIGLRYEYSAYGPRARWCPFCEDARGRGEHRVQGEWFDHTRQGEYLRGGLPAGDPLGGYGAGHTARLTFFPAALPLRGTAWAFFQVREDGNLLEERWPGKRRGGGLELAWNVMPGLQLLGSGVTSHGPEFGWEHGASFSARALLGGPR